MNPATVHLDRETMQAVEEQARREERTRASQLRYLVKLALLIEGDAARAFYRRAVALALSDADWDRLRQEMERIRQEGIR